MPDPYQLIEETAQHYVTQGYEPTDAEPGEWLVLTHPDTGRQVHIDDEGNARVDDSPAVIHDAVKDGPRISISRNRGILDLTVAPDGNFARTSDCRSISLNIEDLEAALGHLGLD